MTDNQLQKLIAKWQARLRVQDWDVRAKMVSSNEMRLKAGKDLLGVCKFYDYMKKVDMLILDEKGREGDASVEDTVVHELVHLILPPQDLAIDTNEHSGENWQLVAYERAIEQLSGILRKAYDGR